MDNSFILRIQAMLDKIKSRDNIKANIKSIEPQLPRIKLRATLDGTATRQEVKAKLKNVNPKVKVDADTSAVTKKIKKLEQEKTETTIQPKVDNSEVLSSLKQTQKETKSLFDRFMSGAVGVNLVRMSVQKVTQAIYQAVQAAKELDAIKTNIQMVSGVTDSQVDFMMSSYNAMAKELSSTTKEVGEAANEFLRMGESIENTNELIKSAQILSKVGMIDSSEAASYLISSLKGYKISAEDSLSIIDKLTSVDMEAAVSAGGLAEAISHCANIADNSGTSMDRLIAYAATIGETTQESMSVIGNSLKSMYSRMNNIKLGRFIDDETGESLSDTEAVLNKLNIQLRDSETTYRDFDDVLEDIGNRWSSFNKVEQNSISVAIAGTMQRERFTALMNNFSNALEYSEIAANSAGNALERFGVYQDSIEAKTNELTAAIESLSTNIISEELYSGIIDATAGIVEFLDKTNLLKGTLAGLMAMGISNTFVSMATGIITATKSTAQLTTAMALFDKGRSVENLEAIGRACKGLSDQQLRLVLSTKGLEDEQRLEILTGMGVEEQERQQTLATLGFATAEDVATGSTLSLRGALNSLKAIWATNPIGVIMTGISIAIGLVTAGMSSYNKAQEEARQKAKEAADEASALSSEIAELTNKYISLSEAVKTDASAKEDLISTQTELLKKLGLEGEGIDSLIEKYGSLSNAIRQVSIDSLKDAQIDLIAGVDAARKELLDIGSDGFWSGNNIINATGEDAVKAFKELEKVGIVDSGSFGTGGGALVLTGDDTTVDGILENYQKLKDAIDALRDSNAFTGEELSDNSLYQAIYARYSEMKNKVEAYNSAIDNLNENLSQQIMLTALQGNEIPKTEEQFERFRQELIDTAIASKQFIGSEQEISDAVNNYLATVSEFAGFYSDPLEEQLEKESALGEKVVTFFDQLTNSKDSLDKFQSSVKSAYDAYSTLLSGNYSSNELLDSIQAINQAMSDIGSEIEWESMFGGGIGLAQVQETLEREFQKYAESILSSVGIEIESKFGQMLAHNIVQAQKASTQLEVLNDQIDSLQAAYSDLTDIVETYNDTGYITFDQLQKLLEMEPQYLSCLIDENGQLQLNEQSMIALANKRLDDAAAQAIQQAITELGTLALQDEKVAVEQNVEAFNEEINVLADYNAELANSIVETNLMSSAVRDLNAAISGAEANGATDDQINTVLTNLDTKLQLIKNVRDQANKGIGGLGSVMKSGSSKSSSSSTKDFEETFDWIETAIDRIERSISNLDLKASSVYRSWSERNSNLKSELADVKKEMDIQASGYNKYMQQVNSVGLSEEWASKVRNGQIDISSITDKALAERIKEYQDWYRNMPLYLVTGGGILFNC